MDVELPDGTVIEGVPEGTTQAEIMRRYNLAAQPAAAPTVQEPTDSAGRLKQDLADVYHGARALGGNILGALTPKDSGLHKTAESLAAEKAQVRSPLVGSLPMIAATAPLAPLVGGAGVIGEGLAAAASPLLRLGAAALGRTAGGAALGGAICGGCIASISTLGA